MLISILIFGAVIFCVWAIVEYYQRTEASDSVPKRLLAAVGMACTAIGAAVTAWFHSGTTP